MAESTQEILTRLLRERILILDGATGTSLQGEAIAAGRPLDGTHIWYARQMDYVE